LNRKIFSKRKKVFDYKPNEPVSPFVSTTKSAGKPTTPPSRPGPNACIRESLKVPTLTGNGLLGI
jgi:hypothetical protein